MAVQSVNRACLIARDFEANHRCRCRNGPSACFSRTTRVPASRTFCQSTPTSSAGSDSRIAALGSVAAAARGATFIPSCCSVNQYEAYAPRVRK
jgi:hypothetical protein